MAIFCVENLSFSVSVFWKQLRSMYKAFDNVPTGYYLVGIIILGFLVRTYVWHFSNWVGLVRHGDGYLFLAQALADGDWNKYFSHWRFLQPAYPIYLTPMFYFKLEDSIYVFWLHQLLAVGTVIFLFLSACSLYGRWCGLAACLIYAIQFQIAYWINWAFSDVAFHFHLSIFLFFVLCCWQKLTRRSLFYATLSGILLIATRPDGYFVLFSSAMVLFYRLLASRYDAPKATVAASLIGLIIVSSVLGFIISNEKIRTAFLSNVHVGWGLYAGTLPTPTNPAAVDKDLIALFREGDQLSKKDTQGRNQWYWASQIGLQRIKENPFKVLKIMLTRYIAVIIPSSFRDHPSWRYLIIDRFFSSYLIIGVLLTLLLKNDRRFYSMALLIVAFSIYTLVSAFQREWDVRVQLSTYILLLGPSSFGWYLMLKRFFTSGKHEFPMVPIRL